MNEKPSTAKLALKWGGLTALVDVLITSIRYALNEYFSFTFPILTTVVVATGTVLAMREYRRLNGGWMTLGEGLGLGLLMFAIIGLADTTYQQVYQTFIDPDYAGKTLAQTRNMMERFGAKDDQLDQFDEQVEAASSSPKKGSAGIAFIGGVLIWELGGLIVSLIAAAFVRRVKTNPFD